MELQRGNECCRMTVVGKRTDDGDQCTLLVVCEVGGGWCLYPHGAAQLGVRLGKEEAAALARVITQGGGRG